MISEKRSITYRILGGVWALVAVYAVLHDQYIVRIAPEHFTEYHKPVPGISNPAMLAFVHALGASISPGLTLGMACVFVGRCGPAPKIPVRKILGGTVIVILATEVVAICLGLYVRQTGRAVFPEFLYPDFSKPMLITQTIQLGTYVAAMLFSGLFLAILIFCRFRNRLTG